MPRKIFCIMILMVFEAACSASSFVELPTSSPSPSPTPSPAVLPSSETAFAPSVMAMSISAAHRAVMGVVSIGGAPITKSQKNIQITGTLQQGKDRMSVP